MNFDQLEKYSSGHKKMKVKKSEFIFYTNPYSKTCSVHKKLGG